MIFKKGHIVYCKYPGVLNRTIEMFIKYNTLTDTYELTDGYKTTGLWFEFGFGLYSTIFEEEQ